MKLRCIKNSIRFRLRKSDMKILLTNSKLKDSINFPTGTSFVYGLILTDHESGTYCENNSMLIEINRNIVQHWAESNEVSLRLDLPTIRNKTLSILIEKDFPCKHTGDDFDDTYHELQPEQFKMNRKTTINLN